MDRVHLHRRLAACEADRSCAVAPHAAIDYVHFWAGGRYLGHDRTAPYSVPWDISALSGTRTVEAQVVEMSGRVFNARPVSVTVANVLPRATVTSPGYYSEIGPVVHQLRGTATAGSGGEAPDRVVVTVDGAVLATVAPAADGARTPLTFRTYWRAAASIWSR